MRSIERYLLAWILGALTLGALLIALVTYLVTLDEMNEIFDADLKNVAQAVATYDPSGHEIESGDATALKQMPATADDSDIVTISWTPAGLRVYASDPNAAVAFSSIEGLSRPRVAGEDWIVYTSVQEDSVVQAAQRVVARRSMAAQSAAKVFAPLLVLALLIGGLLVFALRRGLEPLDGAARDVAARSAESLDPIGSDNIPREIMPLVLSINGLMGRLAAALSRQQRFMGDAAHELRTPLTALRLQLQLLKRSTDEASRADAIAELESGIGRSQHLIEQLLQVARSEHDGESAQLESVDLGELARSVVTHLSVKAEQQGLDLGADAPTVVPVRGDVMQLTILLNNLVENALRYTPAGGVVDVQASVREGGPMLRVIDTGPGIPDAERGRVFDRFYRGEGQIDARDAGGSGLGLAIVRAIADRHRATVSLRTAAAGRGLEVCVLFPGPLAGPIAP